MYVCVCVCSDECHIAGRSKFHICALHSARPNSGVPRLTIVAARGGLRCCNALCIVQLRGRTEQGGWLMSWGEGGGVCRVGFSGNWE